MELFEVKNLTYYYPEKGNSALRDVSFTVSEGEFVLLAGASGCGKSSLLRALAGLIPDYYGGTVGGIVRYAGCSLQNWDKRHLAREVGLIFQDPEQQLVMTSVEQEIAFGLENLGIDFAEMKRRVAEVLSLFNLTALRNCSTFTLSGGQKQKVVLAAVLAMYPRVLLLDEPTSQLDPVSAQELLNYIHRLNLEWGLTVILVEQRTDRCFHLVDRVVLMEQGKIIHQGQPAEMVHWSGGRYRFFMPPVARIFSQLKMGSVPLTIKEGRKLLQQKGLPLALNKIPAAVPVDLPPIQNADAPAPPLLRVKDLEYAYAGRTPCLKFINLSLYPGEITSILGENGSGKTTLLKTVNGLLTPRRGKIYLKNEDVTGRHAEILADRIAYLSQNPNDYLFHNTVQEEIAFGIKACDGKTAVRVKKIMQLLEIEHLAAIHPRDCAGGEKQRIALATVLVKDPCILLLDEPTRGLDPALKQHLAKLLQKIRKEGKAIVVVTHDVEFAAEVASRVVILHDGQVVADGRRDTVLANSLYYAPQANRLFRGLVKNVPVDDHLQT